MFPMLLATCIPLVAQSLLWMGSQEDSEEVNELSNVPSISPGSESSFWRTGSNLHI